MTFAQNCFYLFDNTYLFRADFRTKTVAGNSQFHIESTRPRIGKHSSFWNFNSCHDLKVTWRFRFAEAKWQLLMNLIKRTKDSHKDEKFEDIWGIYFSQRSFISFCRFHLPYNRWLIFWIIYAILIMIHIAKKLLYKFPFPLCLFNLKEENWFGRPVKINIQNDFA